ncbi:hypothetical protein ABZ942_42285 [Nocardia sp. NPDC046473]|uniref:hypothetical protein n=1 Tax=Nocardia sp. NPDC046473 TaxID=3155733 RepID=UPI0034010F75
MEQPDAEMVGTPESVALLEAIVRRRARIHGWLVRSTYSVLIVLMTAMWMLRQYEIAIAVAAVAAFSVFLRRLGKGPLARSYLAVIPPYGQTLSIRFGQEAFELQDTNYRARFPHNRFRSITVEPTSITLRMRNTEVAFPRQLFPDTAIDYLRARLAGREDVATLPPLPPLPSLDQPTATVTTGPHTAAQLAWAVTWRRARQLTRTNAAVAAILILVAVAIAGKQGLVACAVGAGMMILVALAARLTAAAVGFARLRRSFTSYAADGCLLATRFDSDAVDIQTPEFYGHVRYDRITKLTICRHAVLMNHDGRATVNPRELFPDRAIAHMRAANPQLL